MKYYTDKELENIENAARTLHNGRGSTLVNQKDLTTLNKEWLDTIIILCENVRNWRDYAEDLDQWHTADFKGDDMARAMSRPNKPGYYRANND